VSAAAYFDVDGTLVSSNLLQPAIRVILNQATPAASLRRLGRALMDSPRMALAETRSRKQFNQMLFSHYRGITADRMKLLSEEIFEDVIKPALFPGAKELVKSCKDAGLRVVLITGSLAGTTTHLAAHLGADDFISNRLEMKDNRATGKLLHPIVAGPEKSKLIVTDANENGHDLQRCQGYSDSFSDVPMLSVVGQAFCINPDRKLRRIAQAYRWPILDISRRAPSSLRA
jgi:HAD superfamily hydrolase (TIGR01490 family)